MSFWAYLSNRHQQLLTDAFQHASAVFQCMVIATALGVVMVLAGTLGVVILALLFDAAYVLLGRLTIPRGIRV